MIVQIEGFKLETIDNHHELVQALAVLDEVKYVLSDVQHLFIAILQ